MIGDRYVIDATICNDRGPEVAGTILTDAVERTGWLWICQDEAVHGVLLPGEAQAFIDGTRWVSSSVTLVVQPMQPFERGEEILNAVAEALARDDTCELRGITVAVYQRATEPLKEQ